MIIAGRKPSLIPARRASFGWSHLMSPTKRSEAEPASTDRCPITGLPVFRKPEWTEVDFGGNFRNTIHIIGDGILHARPTGSSTTHDVEESFRLAREVRTEAIGLDRPYVEIADWSAMKVGSMGARKSFITNVKNNNQLLAMIFIGVSPLIKISLNIAIRFNHLGIDVKMVNGYAEAITLAFEILTTGRPHGKGGPHEAESPPREAFPREEAPKRAVSNPDWLFLGDNFSKNSNSNAQTSESLRTTRDRHPAIARSLAPGR